MFGSERKLVPDTLPRIHSTSFSRKNRVVKLHFLRSRVILKVLCRKGFRYLTLRCLQQRA
jgi:hypothetical protein